METYGTSPEGTLSKDEKHALETLRQTITYTYGRYQVGILWKPNACLPNNYFAAAQQFKKVKIYLLNEPDKLAMYQVTIANNLTMKYFRKLPSEEIPSTVWILPEHGVTNPNKPGKLRRVSNAKHEFKGACLNEMLLSRPDLISNLLAVICRFRERKYLINADIESKYMQVSVRPEDRKFLRFIWGKTQPDLYEYNRFVFGAKCLPTCANFALQTCGDENKNDYSNVKEFIDDYYKSTNTVKEALQISIDLRKVLATGSFNLTMWITTNPEILSAIPQQHRAISHN